MDDGMLIAFDGASCDAAYETKYKLTGNAFHEVKNLSSDSVMCSLNHPENRWYKHVHSNDHKGKTIGLRSSEGGNESPREKSLRRSHRLLFQWSSVSPKTLSFLLIAFADDCIILLQLVFPVAEGIRSVSLPLSGMYFPSKLAGSSSERPLVGLVLKSSDLGHDSFVQSACSTCWFDCHFQFSHDPVVLEWGISGRK